MIRLDSFLFIGAGMALSVALICGCTSSHDTTAAKASPSAPAMTAPAPAPATTTAPTEAKLKLTVVKADSEETSGEDGAAANAVDGKSDTFWHTQWEDNNPLCPHEIIIELHPAATIKGFTYLPRQDGGENGTIKDYEFYLANSLEDFGQPVAKGKFESNQDLKTVNFQPQPCRYIKLKALSEVNDQAWTSAAEIGVVQ